MNDLNLCTKLVATFLILALPTFISCTGTGQMLSTHTARGKALTPGSYRLVLYGGQHIDDLETVAFLDIEGDEYTIKPIGAPYRYRVTAGMDGKEAVQEGENFLRSILTAYNSYEMRQISAPDGSLIGYELRPALLPFVYGDSDVLNIYYALQENKEVTVNIRKKDRLDRMFFFRIDDR